MPNGIFFIGKKNKKRRYLTISHNRCMWQRGQALLHDTEVKLLLAGGASC